MSWFSSQSSNSAPQGPTFFPVTSYKSGFGELTAQDTAWANTSNKGFQTETQVWYSILEDGSMLMVQVIWSYIGVFVIPATTQMTFKHYNPNTKKTTWRSINATGAKFNDRGVKSDQFEIRHAGTPTTEETYTVSASLDKTVQLNITYTRPSSAPGFKYGEGPEGGISSFGKDRSAEKRDGYVVHRFHPLLHSSGTVIIDGQVVDAKGEATWIHAIQGMRPNLVASRWNFAFFTNGGGFGEDEKLGSVRALQMEFETTDDYGPKGSKSGRTKVNIGAVYTSGQTPVPFLITGQTHAPSNSSADDNPAYPTVNQDISSATHLSPVRDKETSYAIPEGIEFKWEGDRRDGKGRVSADVKLEKAGQVLNENGLIEKVDVLAEIPYVIRKGLAAVTGTKPFIYQWHNPATLNVTLDGEVIPVKGWLYNEASYVSE
ncbi:hypothetical protein CI109_101627 [Kwoniella shandongensis]|uniref:Uncharacterized protein n=1 Tax=Kwoniella shandongensis TaxID=1734106 RepID=A0A5M6CAH4_9TREE|nr:uncharacterized protein CI109_001248 [Kwoniella shandongensis]KAA5530445.1 hypothetical protein CI109_001248 [Kwoniella shandongensis]